MSTALKDVYSPEFIARLAAETARFEPRFSTDGFTASVFDEAWPERELKARMRHIASCLRTHLPGSFRDSLAVLLRVAPSFSGYEAMFFPDYVECYGQDDWDASLPALGDLTQWSSSEFAIRPFILADPERAMSWMKQWAADSNVHRRRLASEGCRPRLPWAMALPLFQRNPEPIWPILETLKTDPEPYVRRSVANNLNDIAKDHPDKVLDCGARWLGQSSDTDWIVKHGFRTLLKAGNPRALALFGFTPPRGLAVENLRIVPDRITIGHAAEFSFDLKPGPTPPDKLRLEYGIDFLKANGKHSRKIFQISESDYAAPSVRNHQRRHDFRQRTTRKHYPGEHRLSIIVNGEPMAAISFHLEDEP